MSETEENKKAKNSLKVIAYANTINNNVINYRLSLKKQKYDFELLGLGEKWENFITKIKSYSQYIKKDIIKNGNGANIICITDSFDVLCCGPPDELLKKFKQFKKPLVFSAECNCLPRNCIYLSKFWKKKENDPKLPYNKYLNSGFIIGYAKNLDKLLDFTIKIYTDYGIDDDQFIMSMYAQQNPDEISLDAKSKIIGTIHYDFFDYKYLNNRIYNTRTLEKPCFLHTPGINSDIGYRFSHFGKIILKHEYISDDSLDKIGNFVSHVGKNKIQKLYWLIIIIVVMILCYFYPKLLILCLILIVIFMFKIN